MGTDYNLVRLDCPPSICKGLYLGRELQEGKSTEAVERILIASLSTSVGRFGRKETGVCSRQSLAPIEGAYLSLRSDSIVMTFQRCASQIHQQWQTSSLTNRPSSPFVRLLLFLSGGADLLQSIAS